jgi:tRNA U34 2-thiouridine synthase MnmA/TrmU
MLAASLVRAQGIDVLALFFETPFFTSARAERSARHLDLPLKIVDITERHLKRVRHPKFGYGENMNPCIDCHTLMVRIAGEMLKQERAQFVITGEVLGQRPMSQNKKSLELVAKESGVNDLLLRPLSAKCLSPTLPETKAWVEREALMDIHGRSRKPQMELAQRLHITDYPSPAGGCMLTEKGFSRRLKDLLSADKDVHRNELELLKVGRHFRITPETKVVVGRNRHENGKIATLVRNQDILFNSVSVPGPTVLLAGTPSPEDLKLAAEMTTAYSDTPGQGTNEVRMVVNREPRIISTEIRDKSDFKCYMI